MSAGIQGSHQRSCWICYSTDPFSSYYHSTDNTSNLPGHSGHRWYHVSSWISRASTPLPDTQNKNNSDTRKNEWVQPCPCKGSMQWVHQSCLLAWTKVQLSSIQRRSFTPIIADDVPPENWWNRIWPISSFGSHSRVSYYINEQLCCPQCKTPYKFQEIPTGIILASLETMEHFTGRALVFISASGVALSIYTLMWVYGYFALRCLMGGEDMYQLMVPLHHHIPWTDSADSIHYPTGDWAKQAVFICSAIPIFPVSLFISSNPTFSRLAPFLLHYFAHLYYPNSPDAQGSYFIMAWIIPLSWNLYKFSRIIAHSNLFQRGIYDPDVTDDQSSESQGEDTLEALEVGYTDYDSDDNRSQSHGTSDGNTPQTDMQVTRSVELAPSSVRINLLSITQILCWPFASAICGRIVLILASRLINAFHSATRNGHFDRTIARSMNWIIGLSPMARNVMAGVSLVVIKDIVSSIMEYYRDKKARSRIILPYYSSQPMQ